MKKEILLACVASLIIASCVKSLYPLTENTKDIVFKKELLGRWKDPKENTEYFIDSVTTTEGIKYKVMVVERKADNARPDTNNFVVMLVNIQAHYFLDCVADINQPSYSDIGEQNMSLLLPAHFILKVYGIGQDYLSMSSIDKDALSLLLQNKKIAIRHEDLSKDDILLTEKPATLQEKLLELEKFTGVYKKDSLVRMK
jgi:hypothetical protein